MLCFSMQGSIVSVAKTYKTLIGCAYNTKKIQESKLKYTTSRNRIRTSSLNHVTPDWFTLFYWIYKVLNFMQLQYD